MKFTQRIQERKVDLETGAVTEFGPSITVTIESEDFPLCPDAVSCLLGHAVAQWLAPKRSISFKSTVDPWPLPDEWSVPYITEGEKE